MQLTPDLLIEGYVNGIFPMAETDGTIYWYAPDPRAVIPIETYRSPKSLRPVLNKNLFQVRVDTNFEGVVRGCALPRGTEDSTWISEEIIESYTRLHREGFAHSVEVYLEDRLVGGLYGVAIGAAFFGESMFHLADNASKVSFHFLMTILKKQGYQLLDTQFINDNVKRYGAVEIPKSSYMNLLRKAVAGRAKFIL